MIKLIVIDLDDTLLDKKKNISFKNIQAIQEAIANHIQIVIASGRPYFRVKPILEKLGMLNNKNYINYKIKYKYVISIKWIIYNIKGS